MKRAIFEFDQETSRLIDDIKIRSHSSSRVEVVRKALYLLDLASRQQAAGGHLIVRDKEGKEKEILVY